jgi:hypothetical protein
MKLLDKGNYEKIDEVFLTKSLDVFQSLSRLQDEYNRWDTDTFMNEVRDAIAAKYLYYTHINTEKHGFDARRQNGNMEFEYLEVKTASFASKSVWSATFNDTTLEKADLFKTKQIFWYYLYGKGLPI